MKFRNYSLKPIKFKIVLSIPSSLTINSLRVIKFVYDEFAEYVSLVLAIGDSIVAEDVLFRTRYPPSAYVFNRVAYLSFCWCFIVLLEIIIIYYYFAYKNV